MFAILFEVLLIEIQEEIHHCAGWEGGKGRKHFVNKHFVNKLAFPINKGGMPCGLSGQFLHGKIEEKAPERPNVVNPLFLRKKHRNLDGRNRAIQIENRQRFKNARFESLAPFRFEIAIRNARLAIRCKHSDTAKLRKGLRFESAIQNR